MQLISDINQKLTIRSNWSFVKAGLYILPLYLMSFMGLFFFVFSSAALYATIATSLLIGLGFWYKDDYELDTLGTLHPFDDSSNSGFQSNRAMRRVIGPAHIIAQIALGTSRSIRTGCRLRQLRWNPTPNEAEKCRRTIQQLQALGTTPRFHAAQQFQQDMDIVTRLMSLGIIWSQYDNGELRLGLNRQYDSHKTS